MASCLLVRIQSLDALEYYKTTRRKRFLHLNNHFLLLFDDSWGASVSAYPEFYHSGIKYFNRFVLKTMGGIEKMLNTTR